MRSMKRPLSILLSLIMIFSMFTIIPITASAQVVGDADAPALTAAAEDAAGALKTAQKKDVDLAETAADADLASVGEHYGIVVGSKVITPNNCDDVMGDGTGSVRYDSGKKVLTLNNPTVTDIYNNNEKFGAIQIQTGGVTIRGSFHMSAPLSTVGLKVTDGNHVTLEGDFTFRGTVVGILANDMAINSGSVTAVSTGSEAVACGIYSENCIVNGGITKVDIQSNYCAYIGDNLTMNQTRLADDAVFYPDERAILRADMTGYMSRAVIEKFTGSYYDLWLGSKHVDSLNYADIYGDGKASFDPSTKVLTLNDPEIAGYYADPTATLDTNAKIYTGYDLTVRGSYTLDADPLVAQRGSPFYPIYLQAGIRSAKSLTFDGSFTFTADNEAVHAATGVTVSSGKLTAVSTSNCAVYVDAGSFAVCNGVETVDMQGNRFCVLAPSIDIGNEMVISYPERGVVIDSNTAPFRTIGFFAGAKALRGVIGVLPEEPSQLGLEGKGTESAPYLIKSVEEWNKLSMFLDYYKGKTEGMYFTLMNDTTVKTMLGTLTNPFSGIFNGDGHTLTLDIVEDDEQSRCVAPFSHVSGATIKNLIVDGSIKGGIHCSALIGGTDGGVNLIENVKVLATINALAQYCGGFVGHGGTAETIFRECAYAGTIKGGNGNRCADMYGWSDEGSKVLLENCIDLAYVEYPIGRGDNELTMINTYYVHMDKHGAGDRAWSYQGKRAYTVSGSDVELTLVGTPGMYYDGTIYVTKDETIHLTASEDGVLYSTSRGSLTQNGRDLYLTSDGNNTTISPSSSTYYTDYSYADSESGNDGETADKLVDGDPSTKWRGSNADTTPVMTFRTAAGFIPCGYLLTTADDAAENPGHNPISWKLEGSANGMDWAVLTEVTDSMILEAENNKTYAFSLNTSETKSYIYFRFTIGDVAGGTTFQLAELQLIGREAPYVGESYKVWVGATQVTTENMNDILNDGGKAKYDPATRVLTLNDPVIEDCYRSYYGETSKIFYEGIDLTLKGSYHMQDEGMKYGICSSTRCMMTFDGDFTFYGDENALACIEGFITVVSGSLTAISKSSDAIYCFYGFTIKNAVKRVEATTTGDNTAIYLNNTRYGGFVMGDYLTITEPEDVVLIDNYASVYLEKTDGTPANHIVIERIKRTVTFDANGRGADPESQQLLYGEKAVEPAPLTDDGWTTVGWYTDPECETAFDFDTEVVEDMTLYAKWKLNEEEGTFPLGDADGDGEITILDATAIQRYLVGLDPDSGIGVRMV